MTYLTPPASDPLTQGDILDACPLVQLAPDGQAERAEARVVVLTQACDLAQRKALRVVVAVVHAADALVAAGEFKAAAVRDQLRLGKTFGSYFLPAAPPPILLPESIIDLRDLHTVPRQLLDALAATGKRVARLAVPYREHLAQHFAVTYMRVALPDPYPTTP